MPLLPTPTVDYSDKDFISLRARLFALIASVFPEWTDQNVANFGNILVELFAHTGDTLLFYLDNLSRESRITTATQRRSLLGMCKLIGFRPSTATAATATLTLSIPSPVAGNVNFAAGDFFSTGDVVAQIRFQLLTTAVILAGATSCTVVAENSATAQDSVVSSGLASQEFVLTHSPYLDDSALVVFANGTYAQVSTFVNSLPTDLHYVVVVDQNDVAHVRFGNGTTGAVPQGSGTITYKTGGGSLGNVEAKAVTKPESSYADTFSTAVVVSCTNVGRASGGSERMSNARIKERAPESIRATINSISRDDFVVNARKVAGVARAMMLTSNQDLAIPENTGILYVVPEGGGDASSALKAAVLTQVTVTFPPSLTFKVSVRSALYHAVSVYAVIYKRQGYTGAQVRASVLAALNTFFQVTNADGSDNTNVLFGGDVLDTGGVTSPELSWSDVQNAVRDVTGVRKIGAGPGGGFLLDGLASDVTLTTQQFPTLGSVTLVDGDTGAVLG